MKGATEELIVKVTYYKKREGLESPQWHFTMHIPQCFSQNSFLEKRSSENVILIFQNIKKTLKDGSLYAKCKKNNTLPKGYTVEEIIPLKDRIEVQP